MREDGMFFANYQRLRNGSIMEWWVTKEHLDEIRKAATRVAAAQRAKKSVEEKRSAAKSYYYKNKDKMNARSREYYQKNAEAIKTKHRENFKLDPSRSHKATKKWIEKGGLLVRVGLNVRRRVREIIRDGRKLDTFAYVGCSREELIAHLESQFVDGMTWDNYGHRGWHIDHIKPLAMANNFEELVPLLHYTNLQPLWAENNWKKGGRFNPS